MGPIAGTDQLAQALSAPDPRVGGAFPVGEMPGGRAIELSFTVLHGPAPGPTVWVIAARDGDEVHATLVAMEVQSRIRPEGLRGTVVVIPVVNVPGFEVLARAHPLAPSFLGPALDGKLFEAIVRRGGYLVDLHSAGTQADTIDWTLHLDGNDQAEGMARAFRSEEHTSELQSQFHLVCRLLLEKKKKKSLHPLDYKKKKKKKMLTT